MAEGLPYLKFNAAKWISGAITLESLEVQGLFANIMAYYWFKSGCLTLTEIKRRVKCKDVLFTTLIDNGLIKVTDDKISISFLDEQLDERGEKSKKNSINGSKGGAPKGNNNAKKEEIDKPKTTEIKPKSSQKQPKSTNIEEKRREESRIEEKRTITLSPAVADAPVADPVVFESKRSKFKDSVFEAGRLTYSKRMLDEFFNYWSEANRSNTKMRWELEKTFEIDRRFISWAKKTRDYPCMLSDSEKSILKKRHEFAISLEKHLDKYSKDVLNAFYGYWSQPENVPEPSRIRWELEEFWDLGQRLSQWHTRNLQPVGK